MARKTHQKTRILFFPTKPLKSLGKEGKNTQKIRNSLQGKKKQGIPQKQGKEGHGNSPSSAAEKGYLALSEVNAPLEGPKPQNN